MDEVAAMSQALNGSDLLHAFYSIENYPLDEEDDTHEFLMNANATFPPHRSHDTLGKLRELNCFFCFVSQLLALSPD